MVNTHFCMTDIALIFIIVLLVTETRKNNISFIVQRQIHQIYCLMSLLFIFKIIQYHLLFNQHILIFPGGSDGKESACNAGDLGSIPELGRSPGGGHGNPLQYSCLENSMHRGVWRAIIHGIAKSQTQLSDCAHCMISTGH